MIGMAYLLRISNIGGFYVISYVLGLYILHSLVQYVTPLGLPDIEEDDDGESKITNDLPLTNKDTPNEEFKPLIRSVNEFDFWKGITLALIIANFLITSEVFDLPVYWPFLFAYFIFLVAVTIKKQKKHMEKYGYSLLDFAKKRGSSNVNFKKYAK